MKRGCSRGAILVHNGGFHLILSILFAAWKLHLPMMLRLTTEQENEFVSGFGDADRRGVFPPAMPLVEGIRGDRDGWAKPEGKKKH